MPGRANHERFSVLQSRPTDFVDRARIAEVDRNVASLDGWIDRVAQIALRDDVDLRIVLGQIGNRLAHSTARPDQRNAHRRFHFAFSNSSTVLRKRVWFASDISHNGKRTSADSAPRQASAVFAGTGFGSINKSLNSGNSLRCKLSADL